MLQLGLFAGLAHSCSSKEGESQYAREEEEGCCEKGAVRERWVRFFGSLLSPKSDIRDSDIPKRLPQQPVASALGTEPTDEEATTAMKAMGPDGLPVELLKLGFLQDPTILRELH